MTELRLCRECKYHMPEPGSPWNLRCLNPIVNRKDSWALSSSRLEGSSARDERSKKWTGKCGMTGRLWEKKNVT